jgi:hypothetical protein
MKNLENIIVFIIVIAIIGGIGYAVVLGLGYVATQMEWLDKEQISILSIGSLVALLCTLILASAIRNNKTKGDRHILPEKAIVYNDFVNYYITIRSSIQKEGMINYRFRSDMVLWAGSSVLKKYMIFNQYLDELSPDNPKILEQAEKVIIEMRNELGQYTYGLKTGDLDNLIFTGRTYQVNNHKNQKAPVS